MAYYVFSMFDMARYPSIKELPKPEKLTLGTTGYNTETRSWAMVMRNPEYGRRNKNGQLILKERDWRLIHEHSVPPDYRMQVLLLPEEP